jgi:hypothetical protein
MSSLRVWVLTLSVCLAAAAAASATPVYGTAVSNSDYSGQRTLLADYSGGLKSLGAGNNPFEFGTVISWTISFNPVTNLYTYSYSFFEPSKKNGLQPLEMSHFILELSPGCIIEGQSDCISGFNGKTEFRSDWTDDIGQSNPGLPGSIYGVKFDENLSTYTFLSDRNPVWGNFYAKKAQDGLWNLGLEAAYSQSGNTLYFVPRPDTDSPAGQIPEPGTLFLLGAGLVALGLIRRRA